VLAQSDILRAQGKSMKLSFKGDKKKKKSSKRHHSDDEGGGGSSKRRSAKAEHVEDPGGKLVNLTSRQAPCSSSTAIRSLSLGLPNRGLRGERAHFHLGSYRSSFSYFCKTCSPSTLGLRWLTLDLICHCSTTPNDPKSSPLLFLLPLHPKLPLPPRPFLLPLPMSRRG
jgi:hypothetical protein